VVQAEQGRARHRRDVDHADRGGRGGFGELPQDAVHQQRVPRGHDAAAEHDGSGQGGQAEAPHRRDGHDRDLVSETIDHGPGHRIAFIRRPQQHGREAGQVVVRDFALVDAGRYLLDPLHAEMAGQVASQHGIPAAAVLRAHRVPEHFEPQAETAAPVARDRAQGQVPGDAAVRRDADGVDTRAADHGDPPVRLVLVGQARPQDGEGVVDHRRGRAPRLSLYRLGVLSLLLRQVGVGQAGHRVPRDPA